MVIPEAMSVYSTETLPPGVQSKEEYNRFKEADLTVQYVVYRPLRGVYIAYMTIARPA